jgi:hypothetical protein
LDRDSDAFTAQGIAAGLIGNDAPPLSLPWTVIGDSESFWVQDASGQTVGWFYFRTDPLVAKTAGVLLRDKARRMAVNFARLPDLLAKLGRGESARGA